MRIGIVGAGPAGLYLAYRLRRLDPGLTRVTDLWAFEDCDLLVGADGVHSVVRQALAERFRPRVEILTNRFAWYGTTKAFATLTLTVRTNERVRSWLTTTATARG